MHCHMSMCTPRIGLPVISQGLESIQKKEAREREGRRKEEGEASKGWKGKVTRDLLDSTVSRGGSWLERIGSGRVLSMAVTRDPGIQSSRRRRAESSGGMLDFLLQTAHAHTHIPS